MTIKITKIRAAIVLAGGLGAIGAFGAWAYFTTTGSGTGTAHAGTSSTLTIHGTIAPQAPDGKLYPGGDPAVVSFTVDNPSNGHQYVNTISLSSVAAYADQAAYDADPVANKISGCLSSWFSMSPVTVQQDLASGNGVAVSATGTLTMQDVNSSQDACKNAYLVGTFSSN
jgi:hypothetical protein